MYHTQLFLSTLNLDQLTDVLRGTIRDVLIEKEEIAKADKYVTPAEATQVGRTTPVTTQTLRNYVKAGLLNKYEINGCPMYKYSEIMALAKTFKIRSRNKIAQQC
jgi:hypothetical protein